MNKHFSDQNRSPAPPARTATCTKHL